MNFIRVDVYKRQSQSRAYREIYMSDFSALETKV